MFCFYFPQSHRWLPSIVSVLDPTPPGAGAILFAFVFSLPPTILPANVQDPTSLGSNPAAEVFIFPSWSDGYFQDMPTLSYTRPCSGTLQSIGRWKRVRDLVSSHHLGHVLDQPGRGVPVSRVRQTLRHAPHAHARTHARMLIPRHCCHALGSLVCTINT